MSKNEEIWRVAVKAPPVWRDNIELWFSNVESQFVLSNITADETKFHHIVSALDSEISSYVADIIKNPPTKDSYDSLKKRLVEQFADSETTRIRTLLSDMSLGDLKPSQLLYKMKQLSDNKVSDEILKMLWMQRLPVQIQQILSVSTDTLKGLADIADKISEVSSISATVSTIHDEPDRISRLEERMLKLTQAVERLSKRNKSKSPSRAKSPFRENRSTCWYHFKFKENARKCKKPCNFQEN